MKSLLVSLGLVVAMIASAAQKSDTFKTPSGKNVTITHIKHATMQIDFDGKVIYVDPVAKLKPETSFLAYPKADYLLLTHEHHDHFDVLAVGQLSQTETAIYANNFCYRQLQKGVCMHNGDSVRMGPNIMLWAVPAYNTTPGREQFHPKGRDNGYVLSLDGLRIYIAGDTEDIPEMEQLKDIDIAFLPCNQPYTMTVDQLVRAAKIIKPKVLFPYHYSDTPINQVLMKLVGSGIDVRIRDYQ